MTENLPDQLIKSMWLEIHNTTDMNTEVIPFN